MYCGGAKPEESYISNLPPKASQIGDQQPSLQLKNEIELSFIADLNSGVVKRLKIKIQPSFRLSNLDLAETKAAIKTF